MGGMEGVFKDIHRCNLTKTLIIYVRIIILIWFMYSYIKPQILFLNPSLRVYRAQYYGDKVQWTLPMASRTASRVV